MLMTHYISHSFLNWVMNSISNRGGNQQIQADLNWAKRSFWSQWETSRRTSVDPGFSGLHFRVQILDPLLRSFWTWSYPQPCSPLERLRKDLPRACETRWRSRRKATPAGYRAFLREKTSCRYAKVRCHFHEADVWSRCLRWRIHYQMVQARSQAW